MYTDRILEHYHHPRHHGTCAAASHHAEARNPTCGDALKVTLTIEGNRITCARFDGDGCAISQSAADILMTHINDASVQTLKQMDARAMLDLLGIPISAGRMKCALLALETAHRAVEQEM